ncbi:polyadenylate-binding protein 2-like isoform X1 [Cucumis melo var. makuwa]|uniref:Polyadenylate-binding protein 2-like isoform X1 n=1 Tax=Cucumis melo var. makuwa TaxID=1194695 RepID=A0A5A7TT00_CUCMM|nr:polyadenylate-binding protein 2-like isoform X1 [Cucumis melo var. makuwa]
MERNYNYDEHEHEVYGGDIPDDAEMDADLDMSSGRADEEGYDAEPSNANSKDLEDMKRRLKEIEEEAGALREMQAKVEKEMGAVQGCNGGFLVFKFQSLEFGVVCSEGMLEENRRVL